MAGLLWKGLAGVALIAAGLFAVLHYDLAAYLAPDAIRDLLDTAGPAAPLVFMGLMGVAVVVSPLPSLPLDVAAGAYWGPWLGTLFAATGALLGAMASFGITRLLGRAFVERVVGGHISFCGECSDHLLVRIVFVTRLIPAISFDLVSYGAGLTKMTLWKFSLATFFGSLPLTFAYTWSGPLLFSGGALPVVGGVLMVALFLVLPRLIERHDLFGLRQVFTHPPAE